MGTGYVRNDTANNIADGQVINASDLDGEYDAIEAAFVAATGHTHDGTDAEGGVITVVGPAQEYVSSASAFYPQADGAYDLGSSGNEWKDLYVDGVAYLDSVDIAGGIVTGITTVVVTETVYAISGTTPSIDPANGGIQTWTLTGNSTPTAGSFASGQSITLMVNDGSDYTITWPTMQWIGGTAPTLPTTGYATIVLWKVDSTLYGVGIGDAS